MSEMVPPSSAELSGNEQINIYPYCDWVKDDIRAFFRQSNIPLAETSELHHGELATVFQIKINEKLLNTLNDDWIQRHKDALYDHAMNVMNDKLTTLESDLCRTSSDATATLQQAVGEISKEFKKRMDEKTPLGTPIFTDADKALMFAHIKEKLENTLKHFSINPKSTISQLRDSLLTSAEKQTERY